MTIDIRPARKEEIQILHEFEKGIVTTERPFDPSLKEGEIHYYDLEALIDSTEAEVLVAVIDGELAGSGYAKILEGEPYHGFTRYAYLGFMYVKPEFRGMGINKQIMERLVAWAKQKEISEIRLQVYDENTIAKNAYLKAGFVPNLLLMRMKVE